ncbi:MAG TPA: homocysteine S-methyltransferase family protein [Rubrobacteraceae bacterium]|nr:homocysteine S-methyltransferase family protein [Rubrobacteraceae bacterium]
MSGLERRIESGDVIVLDGATGTELERRGVPMDDAAWCAAALVTHPETVREVHEDYIRAGADVITTNTFPTARHVLEPAGMGEHFQELNTLAVDLAKQARDNAAELPVHIAGSISTFSPHNDDSLEPPEKIARANYREQAEVLAEAGADLITLEMMRDIEQTRYAVEAAALTGLPIWVGFSCKRTADGTVVLWDGEHTLAEALAEIPLHGASLVSVMHTLVEDAIPALREVTAGWEGPVGAYPHAGRFVMPNWQFTDMISPEDFARRGREWLDLGARVIGGCCGIGPDHIRALKNRLPANIAAEW